ncbi:MAG TPA: CBS domain-containing protein [bacterium]|nr:CBS domain-containing protein [bacterium]
MRETLTFLLGAFTIILFARPVAQFLHIPILTLYILFGILIGPSGFGLLSELKPLQYFYHLGIILLMFSAGLELKFKIFQKNKKKLLIFYFLNGLIPGIGGFFVGIFVNKLLNLTGYSLPLILGSIFISSSFGIIVPLFWEFSANLDKEMKTFSSLIIGSTVMSDITSLFLLSGIITYHTTGNIRYLGFFTIFTILFFLIVFKGLPVLQEKLSKILKKPSLMVEEQTRILILLLILVVASGELMHIHPIVGAFLAGISLANIYINRRVLHHINFITFSIFVPLFFITIGAETNFGVFREEANLLFPLVICISLIFLKTLTGFIGAIFMGFPFKKAIGFGFSTIPQLSATLACAVVGKELGILPEPVFNSIIILTIITTFIGPVIARNLLFPGMKHHESEFFPIEEYIHTDIKPVFLFDSLSKIVERIQETELSIYPVVDKEGVLKGVIHLEDIKNIILEEELDKLIVAEDLLDTSYPFVFREDSLERVIEIFKKTKTSALPVIEEMEEGGVYMGMILLRDILPERL